MIEYYTCGLVYLKFVNMGGTPTRCSLRVDGDGFQYREEARVLEPIDNAVVALLLKVVRLHPHLLSVLRWDREGMLLSRILYPPPQICQSRSTGHIFTFVLKQPFVQEDVDC